MTRWQKIAIVLLVFLLLAAFIVLVTTEPHIATWAFVHFGVKGFGPYYGFWSGAGSDLSELSIPITLTVVFSAWYRKNNCEVYTCWRLGKHDTAAGHTVCRKHHPDEDVRNKRRITHAHVIALHENFLRDRGMKP